MLSFHSSFIDLSSIKLKVTLLLDNALVLTPEVDRGLALSTTTFFELPILLLPSPPQPVSKASETAVDNEIIVFFIVLLQF